MKDKCLKGLTRYSHFISTAGILVNWAGRMPSDSCCPTATPEAPFSSGKAKQPKVHMLTFFRKHTSQKQHSRRPQSVINTHTHTHNRIKTYNSVIAFRCHKMMAEDYFCLNGAPQFTSTPRCHQLAPNQSNPLILFWPDHKHSE